MSTSVDLGFSSDLSHKRHGGADRRAVVSGAVVAAAGVVSTGLLYLYIAHLQSRGQSAGALGMPDMHMQQMRKFWSFPLLQASGLTGLFFAYLSVLLGLQQSARGLPWLPLSYRQIDRLHRQISLLVIGLVFVHVIATALDAMGDSWKTVLIPGQWGRQGWPQADWGYTLGIIAIYVLIVVAPTFYLRRLIGTGRWRVLHRFVLVVYACSIWHALILGLDVGHYSWIRPVIWLAQIPLLALLVRRLMLPARGGRNPTKVASASITATRYALIAVSVAAVLAILAIVFTGHADLIETV